MPEFKPGSGGPKDPPKGDPPAIDPDNPKPEDIKNLQKSLSEKDVDLKKAIADVETLKAAEVKRIDDDKKKADDKKTEEQLEMQKMREDMSKMSGTLKVFNDNERKNFLEKEYPDIMPDLLVGKTDEQIEKIVEKQRTKNKEIYGDSKFFIKPKYESEDDIDKEIEEVKKDKSLLGDQAAVKILRLMREKLNFNK